MYVILVYDVRKKRISKVMKTCRKYLNHLQNSVFEGNITNSKLNSLKLELERTIDVRDDSVCIFTMESARYTNKEQLGKVSVYEHII